LGFFLKRKGKNFLSRKIQLEVFDSKKIGLGNGNVINGFQGWGLMPPILLDVKMNI